MSAASEWFIRIGFSTRSVKESEAQVIVKADYIPGRVGWTKGYEFPEKCTIIIAKDFPRYKSLSGVLLHEFGHYLGLDHMENSIMSPIPGQRLTVRDYESILELRRKFEKVP